MSSVQLSSNSVGHRSPPFGQAIYFFSFNGMIDSDPLKERNFIGHQLEVSNRPLPCPRHVGVSVQRLTAKDYSTVCFGWGHC